MTRRPSFQFYPADWQGNANLRRCTLEERGAWMEVMCLAHDAQEYGILRWPLKEIAQAVGCKQMLLQSLVDKHVLKGADPGGMCEAFVYVPRSGGKDGPPVTLIPSQFGPIWFSSRMVRDEYVRQHRGESSRFEAVLKEELKAPPNPTPMPPFGDGSSSSSSSSTSSDDFSHGSQSENAMPTGEEVLLELPCQKAKTYRLTRAEIDRWKGSFPALDLLDEARRMKFWLQANPTRLKTFKGMPRFFSTWLGNAMERKNSQTRNPVPLKTAKSKLDAGYMAANQDFFDGEVGDVPFVG